MESIVTHKGIMLLTTNILLDVYFSKHFKTDNGDQKVEIKNLFGIILRVAKNNATYIQRVFCGKMCWDLSWYTHSMCFCVFSVEKMCLEPILSPYFVIKTQWVLMTSCPILLFTQ